MTSTIMHFRKGMLFFGNIARHIYWQWISPLVSSLILLTFKRHLNKCLKYNRYVDFQLAKLWRLQPRPNILFQHSLDSVFGNIRHMLPANICSTITDAPQIDCVMIWGVRPTLRKHKLVWYALRHRLPLIIGEDGFLRSHDLGINGGTNCGMICDAKGVYYDSHRDNEIDAHLNSAWTISPGELADANKAMQMIRYYKVSKYNMAKPHYVCAPGSCKHKVLVVDQKRGDQSIAGARASASTFQKMIQEAINENPKSDIIIKTHPDANCGRFGGYYVTYRISQSNVYKITDDVNPISLLEAVDKVYVCSSLMGFEAAILGKEVVCYGASFYSNWGFTTDRGYRRYRSVSRSIQEVFYSAYIENAFYADPKTGRKCSIFTLIRGLSHIK